MTLGQKVRAMKRKLFFSSALALGIVLIMILALLLQSMLASTDTVVLV
jgi:hypothetical protein